MKLSWNQILSTNILIHTLHSEIFLFDFFYKMSIATGNSENFIAEGFQVESIIKLTVM